LKERGPSQEVMKMLMIVSILGCARVPVSSVGAVPEEAPRDATSSEVIARWAARVAVHAPSERALQAPCVHRQSWPCEPPALCTEDGPRERERQC
jgi:hypothetical protein